MSKIDDEKAKKKKFIYIVVGVVVIVAILTIVISLTRSKPKPHVAAVKMQTNSTALAQQSWISKSSAKLTNMQKQIQQVESAQKQQEQQKTAPNQNVNTLGLVPNSSNSTVNYPPPPPAPTTPPPANVSGYNTPSAKPQEPSTRQEDDLIGVVSSSSGTQGTNETKNTLPMPKTSQPSKINQTNSKASPMGLEIPPGSFANAYLLTGADVPTSGNGNVGPIPVVFRVIGDAQMPNLYKSDIKSCFMLGQATGSLASERAYIRIDTLSCITKSGKDIVKSMQGYATGSDGKVGLAGVVVSKQGSMLARALVAGFLQGIGQAFQQGQTNISVSPLGQTSSIAPNSSTILRYGIGGGVGQATTKLADFYMKMANQMFPVIVINAGRTANIIFLKSVKL